MGTLPPFTDEPCHSYGGWNDGYEVYLQMKWRAIPEKQRAKIFEPGFTTKRTGQGMGLFIVNQTVAELGGRITVDSRDGDTVFSGFVPRKRLKLSGGETAQSDENIDIYEENAKKDDNSINKSDANS